MSYSSEVLADSPVGYWPLNESSGTTAFDSSGNGHNGTYSGSFSLGNTGLLLGSTDTCVNFTGGQMAVADTAVLRLGSGAVSTELWINASSMAAYAAAWDDAQRAFSFFLNANGGAGPNSVFVEFGANAVGNEITVSTGIATAELDHIVVTSDGTGNVVVYRNAVSVYSSAAQPTGATNSASGVTLFGNPSAGGGLLQGKAQEFAVYAAVLSPTRVTAHYTAGTTAPPQFTPQFNPIPFMR